jgi:AraC-like DNA-binding protein
MHESLNWINLFTATLGLSAAFYLFIAGKENPYLSKLLSLILFALSIRNFTLGLVNIHVIDFSVIPLYLFVGFQFIVPASVYLYQRALITDELHWKRNNIWHFLPGILVFLMALVSFFIFKQESTTFQSPNIYDQVVQELKMVVPAKYLYFSWIIIAFPYLFMIYKVFVKAISQGSFIGNHGKEIGIWVLIQMIPFTLFYFFLVKEIFNATWNNGPIITNTYHLIVKNIYLLVMVIYVWMKPQLLLGLPKWKTYVPTTSNNFPFKLEIAGWKNPTNDQNQSIQNSNLTLIMESVQKFACTKPEFNHEEFSIEDLSKNTQIPVHHLKFLFRYYQNFGFHGYKNFIRMVKVISQIHQNKHLSHTIESIGESAGFGSNSTMLRTFKKHIGLSPIEIIQQLQTEDVTSQTNNSKLSRICKLIPTA